MKIINVFILSLFVTSCQQNEIVLSSSSIAKGIGTIEAIDHSLKAVVKNFRNESVVSIFDAKNQTISELDLRSSDGEHGFIVLEKAWTPDSSFLVLSAVSSGGHSAWQSFFYVYKRSENKFTSLSKSVGSIVDPKFSMVISNKIKVRVLEKGEIGNTPESKDEIIDLSKI